MPALGKSCINIPAWLQIDHIKPTNFDTNQRHGNVAFTGVIFGCCRMGGSCGMVANG